MPPKESTFRPFIVSYGGENFFLDRDLERARTAKRLVLRLDADEDELTDVQLVGYCENYSEYPRTIIVDNAQKLKGDKALRAFIEERGITDTTLLVVAIVRSEKLPEIWSLAVSKGKVYERKKPKPWENDPYTDFISSEATRLRIAINGEVASMLYRFVGPDFYRLANEIRKLAIYVGQAATVTKDHVAKVTTRTPHAEPFQVADAVINKEPQRALSLLSVLYQNSGDDSLIPIVRALMRQVETTATIRCLQDRGVSESDIAMLIAMNIWRYRNAAAPVARKHDPKSLARHMGLLSKLDADVKGPSRSKRTLVEMAVLSIAQ